MRKYSYLFLFKNYLPPFFQKNLINKIYNKKWQTSVQLSHDNETGGLPQFSNSFLNLFYFLSPIRFLSVNSCIYDSGFTRRCFPIDFALQYEFYAICSKRIGTRIETPCRTLPCS